MISHSFAELIETGYRDFKDKIFCCEKENGSFKSKTYGEFYEDVHALSEKLLDMGLKGKKIMLYGKNSYNWMVVYLSVISYVGIIVPVDKEWKKRDISHILSDMDIDFILYSDDIKDNLADVTIPKSTLTADTVNLIKDGYYLIEQGNKKYTENIKNPESICKIIFTSGTTSIPKKVELTEKNLFANADSVDKIISVTENDRYYLFLPLHHILPSVLLFLYPIIKGVTIYISADINNMAKELQEIKPTVFIGVPKIYERILKAIPEDKMRKIKKGIKLSNFLRIFGIDKRKKIFAQFHEFFGGCVRFMYSGSAPIDENLLKIYSDMGLVILQGYGLTETSSLISCDCTKNYRLGSVGKILDNQEYKIINKDKNGTGELCVKGENIAGTLDNHGFFHTGDLVYFDSENYLYIVGRKKRVIITSNGKNVYPDELEQLLTASEAIEKAYVYESDNHIHADIILADDIPENIQSIFDYVESINKELPRYKNIKIDNIKISSC